MAYSALLLFLILHLLTGAVLPAAKDARPLFFILVRNAAAAFGRKLNREARGDLAVRGMVAATVMTGFTAFIGFAVAQAARYPYGWLAGTAFLFFAASLMAPLKTLRAAADALGKSDAPKAASLLQPYFHESLDKADAHTLARKAAEWSAVSLDIHFLSPLFWFLLLGAEGAALAVTFSALREAFGPGRFGRAARIFDRAFNIAPALIAAVIIAIAAAFVSRSSPRRGLATAFGQWRKYKYGVLGLPVAALAGALGVTLGGPARIDETTVVEHGWIGPEGSSARLSSDQLQRCCMIHFVFFLCTMVLASVILMLK